ncbi:DUF3108 domain-containing protein [Aestuariirhabdus litorea]|nr:DUF3108 domain-containing protein [Aestuariirhabdus litorea]
MGIANHLRLLPLLLLPLTAQALQPYEATYSATYYGQTGEASSSLTRNADGSFTTRFNTDISVLFIKFYQHQSSDFQLQGEQVVPLHYRYSGTRSREVNDLRFDWEEQRAVEQGNPGWSIAINAAVQDELSYQEQLRLDLRRRHQPLEYLVVEEAERLKLLRFERQGAERLQTPWGAVDTVRVKRIRGKDKDRETLLWFAPEWDYLLVRIEHTERGSGYRIELKSATLDGTHLSPPNPNTP